MINAGIVKITTKSSVSSSETILSFCVVQLTSLLYEKNVITKD